MTSSKLSKQRPVKSKSTSSQPKAGTRKPSSLSAETVLRIRQLLYGVLPQADSTVLRYLFARYPGWVRLGELVDNTDLSEGVAKGALKRLGNHRLIESFRNALSGSDVGPNLRAYRISDYPYAGLLQPDVRDPEDDFGQLSAER